MRKPIAIVGVCLLLGMSACTESIKLVNPHTGQTATCGPYKVAGMGDPPEGAMREARCLDDYERQGFVRAP